jgi:hypothetical protein
MDNLTCVVKIGETAKVISVILKETDPVSGDMLPKDLTTYSQMQMKVTSTLGAVIINNAPCVIDANQMANKGKITCTLDITVAAQPGIVPGTHRLEFNGLNAAGKQRYWPIDEDGERTYGTFIIQRSL